MLAVKIYLCIIVGIDWSCVCDVKQKILHYEVSLDKLYEAIVEKLFRHIIDDIED